MSSRAFTVFQDEPSTQTSNLKASNGTVVIALGSKNSKIENATALAPDKENVDPTTGQRAGSSVNTKKRKTSVLVVKAPAPLSIKSTKESKDAQPEPKKRKASSSSSDATTSKSSRKGKAAAKKEGKVLSSSSRKVAKKPSRRPPPLPRVDEELPTDGERDRATQASIDSKCYDLTVKPLADVSGAYEQGLVHELAASDEDNNEKIKFRTVKESSLEPELRDFLQAPLSSPLRSTTTSVSDTSKVAYPFSTPERQKIYAAFTFTSPSPSSERFSKAKRANSVPPLHFV